MQEYQPRYGLREVYGWLSLGGFRSNPQALKETLRGLMEKLNFGI
jgi:hypothetical protein